MNDIKTFAVESLAADMISARPDLDEVREVLRLFRHGEIPGDAAWERLTALDTGLEALDGDLLP